MTNYKNAILFLTTCLFVSIAVVDSNICCMPRGHRVSLRTIAVVLTNCTANGCVSQEIAMSYTHYPDLDNYRYRMDYHGVPRDVGPFAEGTTLGFITNKTSFLGYEYHYDDNQCTCQKTTQRSIIYEITCVADQLQFISNISIGVGFNAQLYRSNSTTTVGPNTVTITYNMAVQNFSKDENDVPLCALIHEDYVNRVTVTSNEQLVSVSTTTLEAYDFTPYTSDSDYVVPSYCPKSC